MKDDAKFDPSPVQIDESQLDKEWLTHAETFYQAAVELATARAKVSEAKAGFEVIEAGIAKRIRTSPESFGVLKVTEGTISEAIKLTPEYDQALSRLNKAKYRMDMCQALVDALDHKKKALESLVYLHGQNYFSSPRVKLTPEMEKMTEKAKEIKAKRKA